MLPNDFDFASCVSLLQQPRRGGACWGLQEFRQGGFTTFDSYFMQDGSTQYSGNFSILPHGMLSDGKIWRLAHFHAKITLQVQPRTIKCWLPSLLQLLHQLHVKVGMQNNHGGGTNATRCKQVGDDCHSCLWVVDCAFWSLRTMLLDA